MIVIAGRAKRPTARHWEARMLSWARWLAVAAFASGLVVLAVQTALFEGRPSAALEIGAVARVLAETQAGRVWLVRFGFLVLLATFLMLRLSVDRRVDWRAARGEALLLGAAALVPIAAAGHAAAVEPDTARAIAVDALHVIVAGVWVGGLVPLALLLREAATSAGADARPYAVLAARRFSRLALGAVLTLAVTGALLATLHVGSVAGLVGTRYGWLLLAKILILALVLLIAAVNRQVLLARLAGDGPTVGRPAMRRLAGYVAAEAGLGLAILAIVAALSITPPARHEPPVWPFSVRLSLAALETAPGEATRALIGSQVAVLGLVGLIAAVVLRGLRLPLAALGFVALGAGAGLALPPLAIDAYPTTYLRPTVPYQAASIASGAALYQEHCAACHGAKGAGDGPAARTSLDRPQISERPTPPSTRRETSSGGSPTGSRRPGCPASRLSSVRISAGICQLPAGALGGVRRARDGTGGRARSAARRPRLRVRGRPDAVAHPAGLSRAGRPARALHAAGSARPPERARRA